MAEFISETSPPQMTTTTLIMSSGSFNSKDVMQVGIGSVFTTKTDLVMQPNRQSTGSAQVCTFTATTMNATGPATTIGFGQMAVLGVPVAQEATGNQTPVQYWS